MEKESNTKKETKPETTKTSTHAGRYLFTGTFLAVFNYGFYTLLANVVIKNNDLIWLSTLICTSVTTILAFLLHSKITWKEREITKASIYKFFIWNALLAIAISPLLTQLFSFITPLYDFAFHISSIMHLPFTYDFILTTGAFVLTAIVTTILNFLFYDRFVFGKKM